MRAALIRHTKIYDEYGNITEIKMWKVPPSPDKPHGYKYSLVYIVKGKRVIGYDNAERKGDHRHEGDAVRPYPFKGLRRLAEDFLRDIEEYRRKHHED